MEAEITGVKADSIKILGLEQKTDADNNKDNKISIEDDEKKRNWIREWVISYK